MKQKKRLCIVYWDLGLGGIQKRICDFSQAISYDDWDVYILLRRKISDGFEINLSPKTHVLYYPFTGRIRMPLGFVFWIARQYIVIRPNVVVTFQSMLSVVLVILKKLFFWVPTKLVLNEGAVTSRVLKLEHIRYMSLFVRFFYPLADRIIVPTNVCKRDLMQHFGIQSKKIFVVPNWTLVVPPTAARTNTFDVVYIGRFDTEKNPLYIVQLAHTLIQYIPHL